MRAPLDDRSLEEREKAPTPETLSARERLARSRWGRLGRLRSWATLLLGLAFLAVALWLQQTR